MIPAQGEIWWAEDETGRRPVLVVTRSEAIPVLRRVMVAPVTRTVRDIPTEIPLGPPQGLPVPCVASFDNLFPVRRSVLTGPLGHLGPSAGVDIWRALAAVADCPGRTLA